MDETPVVEIVIVPAPMPLRIKSKPADPANYSKVRRERVQFICLHATDGVEGPRKDDDEAAAIAKPLAHGKEQSFHYVVDSDSATRCVPDLLTAWHAKRTGNLRSIGVEICGRANQTRAQWADPVSLATLGIAVRLVADLCQEHALPTCYLDADQLRLGARGISTHAQVSVAWKESNHWDPGPHFPMTEFVAAVKHCLDSET